MSESVTGAALRSGEHVARSELEAAGGERGSASVDERARVARRVLIIVENLPCPFDRRVWQEARTLNAAGYIVSIICPKAPGYEKSFEQIDGPPASIKAAQVESFGARLEVRLDAAHDEPADVVLEFACREIVADAASVGSI